jgi:hypothetical protein
MATERPAEPGRKAPSKKTPRRPASNRPASKSAKEKKTVSLTTTAPAGSSVSVSTNGQKGFLDFLGGIVPDLAESAAQAVAPSLGIDPRVAGQTVSQVLSIFGVGGGGKAFTPAIPKEQVLGQMQQVVTPYLDDKAFTTALQLWMRAALEPVQAHKEGKAYQPSVDLSKNWFTDAVSAVGDAVGDAVDTVSDAVSNVNWQQVGQIGMQLAPYAAALL